MTNCQLEGYRFYVRQCRILGVEPWTMAQWEAVQRKVREMLWRKGGWR